MLEKIKQILKWKREPKQVKYPLKFYDTRKDRWNVQYKEMHLCPCKTEEKEEIQEYFDTYYTGDNLLEISKILKEKYNLKIQLNKKYPKGKKSKKQNPLVTYQTAKLCFNPTPSGRLQVKTRDRKREVNICSCYPEQMEEVQRKYDLLKKDNSLDAIKIILKQEYNLR